MRDTDRREDEDGSGRGAVCAAGREHDAATRRCAILRRQADFQRLRAQGKSVRAADVVVVYRRTAGPDCRYAVVASRRVGKATRRNRAKRILREAQRGLLRQGDLGGVDLLLIARAGAVARDSRTLQEQIRRVYVQEGLLAALVETPPVEAQVETHRTPAESPDNGTET